MAVPIRLPVAFLPCTATTPTEYDAGLGAALQQAFPWVYGRRKWIRGATSCNGELAVGAGPLRARKGPALLPPGAPFFEE